MPIGAQLCDNHVNGEACIEFLTHGLKYVFPAELGPQTVGIPTSYARPGFNFIKHDAGDIHVWPHPDGKVKGASLLPLYQTLPQACLQDESLYSLASLVEMIRVGRAREQKIAADKLKKLITELS